MGAEAAVEIIFQRELKQAENPVEKRAELIDDYRETFYTPRR